MWNLRIARNRVRTVTACRLVASTTTQLQNQQNATPTVTSCHREQSASSNASHDCNIIKEGEAEIFIHKNDVFYNKAQVVNRDLSIAVLRAFVVKRKREFLAKQLKYQIEQKHTVQDQNDPAEDEMDALDQPSPLELKDEANVVTATSTSIMPPIYVLEALAASGLRAIRYAREVEGVDSVVALDYDKVAVEACKCNIKLNGKVAMAKVRTELADARVFMMSNPKQYDVVDVDPYGSPAIFLDSAVQCVRDGGMLMCTATDTAILCGNHGEVCYTKYGSYPLKGKHCYEMAVRILLSSIESHANRYKRHIVPILSVSMDFYVRVFVRIYTSPLTVKSTPSKLSYVFQCVGCNSFFFQPVGRTFLKHNVKHYMPGVGPVVPTSCLECGEQFEVGGPVWSEPIHDKEWVSSIYRDVTQSKERYPAYDKVHGLLTAVSEELLDVPLYVNLHDMSAVLRCNCPPTSMFASALVSASYRTSCSHASPLALKTDAPMNVIWDFMRCWVKLHPVKEQHLDIPGKTILSKKPVHEANFCQSVIQPSKARRGIARFIPNPERNWGPKSRAGRHIKTTEGFNSSSTVVEPACKESMD